MKKNKIYFITIILIGTLIFACKRNDFSPFSDNKKTLDNKRSNTDNEDSEGPINSGDPIVLQNLEQLTEFDISNTAMPTTESAAITELAPLKNNSLEYFYDAGLSSSDLIAEFGSLDNPEIAYAAIVLEAINAQGGLSLCSNDNVWIKCLVEMALPCSILEGNVFDDFRQGIIEKGAKAAFKALPYPAKKKLITAIGRKAVQTFGGGYLSLAIFVYDYGSCLMGDETNVDMEPSSSELINSTGFFVVPDRVPVLLNEFNSSGNYWYIETKFVGNEQSLRNLANSDFQQLPSTFLYRGLDDKIYADLNQTILAPDGFYWNRDVMPGLNYREYSYIKDGIITLSARKYL